MTLKQRRTAKQPGEAEFNRFKLPLLDHEFDNADGEFTYWRWPERAERDRPKSDV